MGLSAGTKLGPYEIVAPLGAGGMGEVYRARDTRLGRDVAVKVLHPRLAADPDASRASRRKPAPPPSSTTPTSSSSTTSGRTREAPSSSRSFCEGESLREKLGAPLPPKKAVDYAIQIAHGLAAAHEKGIVHRDIKPENVFVTKDGHVKILDFGVAKLRPSFEPSGVDTETPTDSATQPGAVLGTVGYMSPEQIRGQPVDARTDLFSLGVVLYEMLSGKRPFQRETARRDDDGDPARGAAGPLRDEPERPGRARDGSSGTASRRSRPTASSRPATSSSPSNRSRRPRRPGPRRFGLPRRSAGWRSALSVSPCWPRPCVGALPLGESKPSGRPAHPLSGSPSARDRQLGTLHARLPVGRLQRRVGGKAGRAVRPAPRLYRRAPARVIEWLPMRRHGRGRRGHLRARPGATSVAPSRSPPGGRNASRPPERR